MSFTSNWTAEVLSMPPMIAPVRQFTYPMQIAGEEDALAQGALFLMVKPESGGSFLATCVRGFKSERMPTGVFSCPNPQQMCAVAGGYAYIVDVSTPERCAQIGLKPVVSVLESISKGLLIFVGFHSIVAWDIDGLAWETEKLSWEGVRITEVSDEEIVGLGWDLMTDQEMEFRVDLRTGKHFGGIGR